MKKTSSFARPRPTPEQSASGHYKACRMNLLLVAVFSLINVLALAGGSFQYFLFSASVPYIITDFAMAICGKYPEELYEGGYLFYDFYGDGVFFTLIAIALVIIAFYVLCFFLSKRYGIGWIFAAAALFLVDTGVMLWWYGTAVSIMDIVFHFYVLFFLVLGIVAHFRFQKLQKKATEIFITAPITQATDEDGEKAEVCPLPDSTPLRDADMSVKSRIFLTATVLDHTVIYRRVKRTNELVIDGRVYAEYTALIEKSHVLSAAIDGHAFAIIFDGFGVITLTVDNKSVGNGYRLV